ncbi:MULTISPECIES: phenylalanine--tRNA ligase subunit beta [unclassified Bacillus (in: firmicutes)]|uniref:phenylalanine--tRNA ligase subunit beta n=1 Tax=unclassified Bacillus (in: firmicutes) TaxID=185979 RepID=UPI00080AFAB1|nr:MULTISPECIES: phenylalanine--tRNA ligase subunit beta [unclassified Bacillus (in: firmicutes)]OCA81778.1 phenylalanine--tRNA ligase subunit beta [Bacillus sp. FJAT-27986]
MFVSYRWLQDYVDLDGINANELAEKITRSGIEVEGVESPAEVIQNVVIGHVLEKVQHPNADKLSVCKVDIGEEEPVQIVCGAPNVAAGQKVPVAKVGAVLPGNFKIKKSKLRGEASHGMICSLQELGIEAKVVAKEFSTGIFVFPEDVVPGTNALEQLGLDDHILELGLTPNRSDCLSMLGVAYEVAAILGKEVKVPEVTVKSGSEKAEDYVSVKVDAPEQNPLYIAKIIKDVKVGPSPLWLQSRLMKSGIRPHNNVVDITNFILLEYGQPLHAFDYDRLQSKEIVVRMAHEGEKLTTLDEAERTLSGDHLVITNGKEAIALAGVMGGANSEVVDGTTTVLLEAAYFAGGPVRKASKDFGLRSEASARFEKGVDPNRVRAAGERAAELIAELAGGTVLEGQAEFNEMKIEEAVISIGLGKINKVLGTSLSVNEVKDILTRLQFEVKVDGEDFVITVPTRRGDITIPEDIIEEVARLYGYDNIPKTLPVGASKPGVLTPYQMKRRVVRRYLEEAGLMQNITYSLTSAEKATMYTLEQRESIRLAMPMSEERSTLRMSLIPGLLDVLKHNVARQNENMAVYETGAIFLKTSDTELPEEKEHLAGAVTGLWNTNLWQGEKKKVDFFVVKGILEGLFRKLGLENRMEWKQAIVEGMHPGRTAELFLDGELIGFVGQVHPKVEKKEDLKETYVFELSLVDLLHVDQEPIQYTAIPRFPSITRDIALVVDSEAVAGEISTIIKEAGGKLLKEVHLFDLYEGEKMEEGKKSLAFSLKYFDPEKTLTDEEVTKAHSKVLMAVEEKAGAQLRG